MLPITRFVTEKTLRSRRGIRRALLRQSRPPRNEQRQEAQVDAEGDEPGQGATVFVAPAASSIGISAHRAIGPVPPRMRNELRKAWEELYVRAKANPSAPYLSPVLRPWRCVEAESNLDQDASGLAALRLEK